MSRVVIPIDRKISSVKMKPSHSRGRLFAFREAQLSYSYASSERPGAPSRNGRGP